MFDHQLIQAIHNFRRDLMAALDNLNANISKLSTDVEALIAKPSGGGIAEADVQTAADNVAALDAKVEAALNSPTP